MDDNADRPGASNEAGTGAHDDPVLVHRRGRVLIVTINRPRARNAVNYDVSMGIGEALADADADADIWAVVLTGAGDVAFSAGADLKALAAGEQLWPSDPRRGPWGFGGYVQHHISKPTIAAVNGFALGGGLELVLASDLVVATETATFGLPEVSRGILAAAGGVTRLPAQVPAKVAMEMILTGTPVTAATARELHLVNALAGPGRALEAALDLAERVCANAPLAVQASKRVARGIIDGTIASEAAALAHASSEMRQLMRSRDAREGPQAFAEKRPAVWEAR